jgi:hypothetical protein
MLTPRMALAQLGLVGCAVQVNQELVDFRLVKRIAVHQLAVDDFVHILNGLQHAFALVAALIAVA